MDDIFPEVVEDDDKQYYVCLMKASVVYIECQDVENFQVVKKFGPIMGKQNAHLLAQYLCQGMCKFVATQ